MCLKRPQGTAGTGAAETWVVTGVARLGDGGGGRALAWPAGEAQLYLAGEAW